MKEFLKQNGFKPWGGDYLFEMGTKRIFARFKPKNKSQLELLETKYKAISPEILDFYSKYNGTSYTLQGRTRNIEDAKICSLNEMFDKFKEEANPFPDTLDLSEYNQSFDLQASYLKKEHPFIGKLYSKEEFEEFDTFEAVHNANVIRRVKKIATIYGYDDDIVIDLQSQNEKGYQIYLLAGRSGTGQGLYPLDISFTEFIQYFLLFGFIGHWYIAFIPKSCFTKKQIRVNSHIKELEKHFLESSIHQEKLKNIVSNFNAFK